MPQSGLDSRIGNWDPDLSCCTPSPTHQSELACKPEQLEGFEWMFPILCQSEDLNLKGGLPVLPWKETTLCQRKWWGNICRRETSLRFHFQKDYDLLSLDDVLLSHYPLISGYHLGLIPGREDPLEKRMPIHSSILDWRIPWIEKPLQATVQGVTKGQTRLSN